MKKVLIIIPSLRGGGAERVASQLANRLQDKFDVTTIVFNNEDPKYTINGSVIDFQTPSQSSVLGKFNLFIKRLRALRKVKKDLDADVAISFLSSPNLLNLISNKGEKSIVSIRNYPSRKEMSTIEKFIENRLTKLYYKADSIVPVSEAIADDIVNTKKISRDCITTIYNPVNMSYIIEKSKETIEESIDFDRDTFNFITVGNLRKVKGHIRLIKIFNEFNKINNEAHLYIVGEGPERESLEMMIKEFDLRDCVHLLGYQENPYKFMDQSDVFLLSSYSEGFPNSIIEAMVLEKPIVATNCLSGPLEILSNDLDVEIKNDNYFKADYGLLCPAFSNDTHSEILSTEEKAFLKAMIDIQNDKDLYQKYSTLSKVRANNFEINKIIQKWETLINELVDN